MRSKKVKNLGFPILMKISPEKLFGAGNSMVSKFSENFDPKGSFWGSKVNFRVFLRSKKVKNLGSPILKKISPEKLFGTGNSKIANFLENFYPKGVILRVKGQF